MIGPVEALKMALSKEIEAARIYDQFSREYPAAKEIFIFLMQEEERHKSLIKKRIAELTKE